MNTPQDQDPEVRMELVTATFVAAGRPTRIDDLGPLLAALNDAGSAREIELRDATVRPLYRSGLPLQLEAPMLVRRDEIIFGTFEGPDVMRGAIRPPEADVPVLLLAPPFQIQGIVMMPPGADRTRTLRDALQTFFTVRRAQVFDAEGNALGEGEQIIVNGAAVVMTSVTAQHIPAIEETPPWHRSDAIPAEGSVEPEDERAFQAA